MPTNTPVSVIGGAARVLERLPRDLEEQPLLRIHAPRFARRDLEKLRVEPVEAGHEGAVACVHLARRVGIRIVERVQIPAVGRHLADGVGALVEQLPVGVGGAGRSGQPATDADDRNRLAFLALERLEAHAHLAECGKRLLVGTQRWLGSAVAHSRQVACNQEVRRISGRLGPYFRRFYGICLPIGRL
jgi:hypothetical protein